ncbi:MAG TPA: alpha/beta fold hydrolase [Patescibacteria group bacterium]|nr:alpha/beta fold hydrolase [Patescibacteria group bacterium]
MAVGLLLTAPAHTLIGPPPADLQARQVVIPSPSGALLQGWLVPGQPGKGAVALFHGVWRNRLSMLRRARLLKAVGFSVLLIDFQAAGESSGQRISFGHLEALDARAAVDFLRHELPGERVGVIGVSLGGAATLLGPTPLPVDALVVESVYPDIRNALNNRLRVVLGPVGPIFTPLFQMMLKPILGVSMDQLRPIKGMSRLPCPVLVASGTADNRTLLSEAQDMFTRAPEPKRFWAVNGAGHVDLEEYAPEDYRRVVLPFLRETLARP